MHSKQVYISNNRPSQGVHNHLLLVQIVGGACFRRHQLVAVLDASLSIFQMTLEILHINRMEREANFCDIAHICVKHHEKGSFVKGTDKKLLCRISRCLQIPSNPTSMEMFRFVKIILNIVLQSSSFPAT